jgi:hypothetical protein
MLHRSPLPFKIRSQSFPSLVAFFTYDQYGDVHFTAFFAQSALQLQRDLTRHFGLFSDHMN